MPLTTLQAFEASSSINASHLSLGIRTLLLMGFLVWASSCVLSLFYYYRTQKTDRISDLLSQYIQLFFLISVIVTLVFIY